MMNPIRRFSEWRNGPLEAAWQKIPLWVKGGVYTLIGMGYVVKGTILYRAGNQLDAWQCIGTGGFIMLLPIAALVLWIFTRRDS